jgi:hypothetical protein
VLQDPTAFAEAHRSAAALKETPSCHPIRHLIGTRPPLVSRATIHLLR